MNVKEIAVARPPAHHARRDLGALWLRREAHSFRLRWDELMEGAKRQAVIEDAKRQEVMA